MTTVAALDVGGTRIKAALVHSDGRQTHDFTVPTPRDLGRHLGEVAAALLDRLTQASGSRPAALGVAAPGLVDETRGVGIRSANLGWRDLDLRGPLVAATGLPVAIGHDVRAGLVAEAWVGAARDCLDVLFVAVGTGISAALRIDGRDLVAGGYAGEIGHVPVEPDGPACGCGAHGCLEAVASAQAIARTYAQRAQLDPAAVSASRVAEGVIACDPLARSVWMHAVDHLARVLAITALASGARLIVVGGGLVNAGGVLMEPLTAGITTYGGALRTPQVVPATLGDQAGCLGAGRLALQLLEAT